jgi:predicted transcriptional regulator
LNTNVPHLNAFTDVLDAISTDGSLRVFNIIASSNPFENKSVRIKEKAKLTRHKFNSIISKLVNINLIEGGNGRYRLTQLGCLTLSYVNLIQDALNMHWKLKAIDLIEGSDESIKDQILQTLFNTLPNEELKVLVKKSCSYNTNRHNQQDHFSSDPVKV